MSDASPNKPVKKVVLAYSGGLDTSIILKWLQTTYGCEVVTFTADLGQGEELEPARRKAELLGIKSENIFIEDLREEFVATTSSRCSAQRRLRGRVSARHVDRPAAHRQEADRDREKVGADAVCHGATGKGNDQVRFELGYYALKPDVTVIAPWREWDLRSREQLIAFAEQHQIPIAKDKRGESPFSVDANLLHASSEGKVLEDPAVEVPDYVYSRTLSPKRRPTPRPSSPSASSGATRSRSTAKSCRPRPARQAQRTGTGQRHRPLDLVENRFVGMKSRGMYETPGGTILLPPTAPSSRSRWIAGRRI